MYCQQITVTNCVVDIHYSQTVYSGNTAFTNSASPHTSLKLYCQHMAFTNCLQSTHCSHTVYSQHTAVTNCLQSTHCSHQLCTVHILQSPTVYSPHTAVTNCAQSTHCSHQLFTVHTLQSPTVHIPLALLMTSPTQTVGHSMAAFKVIFLETFMPHFLTNKVKKTVTLHCCKAFFLLFLQVFLRVFCQVSPPCPPNTHTHGTAGASHPQPPTPTNQAHDASSLQFPFHRKSKITGEMERGWGVGEVGGM